MASYYPDCGHEYCDCPAHPSYAAAEAKRQAKEAEKKTEGFRAVTLNLIKELNFIIGEPIDDDDKLKQIKSRIKMFRSINRI